MGIMDFFFNILTGYTQEIRSIGKSIEDQGTIPAELCKNCFWGNHEKHFIEELTVKEMNYFNTIKAKLSELEVVEIRYDPIHFSSNVNFTTLGSPSALQHLFTLPYHTNEGILGNVYSIPKYSDFFNGFFVNELLKYFSKGVKSCVHNHSVVESINSGIIPKKLIEIFRHYDNIKSTTFSTLYFGCESCIEDYKKYACDNAIEDFGGGIYKKTYNCSWEFSLLKHTIQSYGIEYQFLGLISNTLYLPIHKVLCTIHNKVDALLIEKLTPELIIIHGNQKDVINLMKYNVPILCIEKNSLNILRYDLNTLVNNNLETVVMSLSKNFINKAAGFKGPEKERYIKSLITIGSELGFTPQINYSFKKVKPNCVWRDNNGKIFSAINIETNKGIKKDVLSLLEIEPEVVIIVTYSKSESAIREISENFIFKYVPQVFIFINLTLNRIYVSSKQEMLNIIQMNPSGSNSLVEDL